MSYLPFLFCALTSLAVAAPGPTAEPFVRQQDIVYDRKYGTALTLDEFKPTGKWNGAAVIWVISGGWFSSHNSIDATQPFSPIRELTRRGYRVYAVVHRSNPYFTIEDAVEDVLRSVRFIRHTASQEDHTTMPIGIMGGSAGGHLSLMAGTAGDDGKTTSSDPVEQAPSRVQAVGCYFPPTDFLNYGKPGVDVRETSVVQLFRAPFEFKRFNEQDKTVDPVTSYSAVTTILKEVSPVTHVTADDAPALIIHGDSDELVPIQQAHVLIDKMISAGVKSKLVVRPGAGHGWAGLEKDNLLIFDWFDQQLLKAEK